MSPTGRPPLESGTCFREAFIARFDPEAQEAVRLFGRLLEDLALERSLEERGARADFELELAALVAELTELSRTLQVLGTEAAAHPLSARDLRLGGTALNAGEKLLDLATELAEALGGGGEGSPPSPPRRRKSDGPRPHLRPVPPPPGEKT